MQIIFVRHGHPNYKDDCLTELGHLQAKACAERLKGEHFDALYSSTCGRAMETAEHIAEGRGQEIVPLEFMREIRWGSIDEEPIYERGHPWYTADKIVAEGQSLLEPDWAEKPPFDRNKVDGYVDIVVKGLDEWLQGLGYRREGLYYRVESPNEDRILLASHAGSSGAVLSHLLNLPFPFVMGTLQPDFTGIHVLSLDGEEGTLISPVVRLLNDARHIEGLEAKLQYE
ncbi:MAG: histidine phosphatase family protein [Clostridia bacterium]|nr:histidine phosphatase family protein [Clostridia bacterium]